MNYQHATLDSCGYWGALNYAHVWLSIDSLVFGELSKNDGKFDSVSLSEVLRLYSVRRGFPALVADKRNRQFGPLVEIVNRELMLPPSSLTPRAKACWDIAEELRSSGVTVGRQFSAISKLSWFLAPRGWTVFDSFVAKALSVTGPLEYYQALENIGGAENGFIGVSAAIGRALEDSDWSMLRPERVIDGILLNKGGLKIGEAGALSERRASQLSGLIDGLPYSAASSLVAAAHNVQSALDEKCLGQTLK